MKKIFNLSAAGLLGGTLVLAGCAMDSMVGGSDMAIDHLKMDLPQQIEWVQVKKKPGVNIQEWVIKGFKSNNSPARVIYQKISPAMPADALMTQVMKPFKSACKDIKVSDVPLNSKYANKMSKEMICSQLGKNPVGLIAYTTVMSDKNANHLVVGEVRTLPSKKAGQFDIKNEQQQKQVQTSAAIAQLMAKMTTGVKVCDSKDNCK